MLSASATGYDPLSRAVVPGGEGREFYDAYNERICGEVLEAKERLEVLTGP